MKMTKPICTLALALVVSAVLTGCGGHRVHHAVPIAGRADLAPPEPGPGVTLGSEPQPDPGEFLNGMKMDRAALAGNTIHFAYDSAAIRKADRNQLEAVAQTLSSNPGTKVLVEGNCDERGTEEYNRSLGERRAGAARSALIKMGVSSSRIMTKSFGKDKPANPGHDDAARAENRRDDFVLLRPGPGGPGGS